MLPRVTCSPLPKFRSRIFSSSSVKFNTAFNVPMIFFGLPLSSRELLNNFNNICSAILDDIVPFKTKMSSHFSMPWINENIHVLKRKCRKVEQLWKSSKLAVHVELLRSLLNTLIQKLKTRAYFATLFNNNQSNPRMLDNIVSCVIDPPLRNVKNFFPSLLRRWQI